MTERNTAILAMLYGEAIIAEYWLRRDWSSYVSTLARDRDVHARGSAKRRLIRPTLIAYPGVGRVEPPAPLSAPCQTDHQHTYRVTRSPHRNGGPPRGCIPLRPPASRSRTAVISGREEP